MFVLLEELENHPTNDSNCQTLLFPAEILNPYIVFLESGILFSCRSEKTTEPFFLEMYQQDVQ